MRPWGRYLAEHGHTVDVPRLPGHGTSVAECNRTRWADWYAAVERSYLMLRERCDTVFVGGGTPFLPPVAETIPLELIECRTFGSRVIVERYRRVD